MQSLQSLITFDVLVRDPQCYTFLESLGTWEFNGVSLEIIFLDLWQFVAEDPGWVKRNLKELDKFRQLGEKIYPKALKQLKI